MFGRDTMEETITHKPKLGRDVFVPLITPDETLIDTNKLVQDRGAGVVNPKDAIGVNKLSMSAVPCGVLAEVAAAMMEGAKKYGRHNFRGAKVRHSIYYDATMRHLMAWWEGEDVDPDSGLSHVAKAIASLVVLRDGMMNDMAIDNRPPPMKNPDWLREISNAQKR